MADARFDVPPLLQAWVNQSNESNKSFRLWNAGLLLAFVSIQAAMSMFLLYFGVFTHSPLFFRACLGLMILFVLADAVFVMGIARNERQVSAERRIAEAEQELQGLVEEYEAMHAEMRQIARLRHDARNHLQVIASLSEKGEYDAARAMANDIADRYLKEHADV